MPERYKKIQPKLKPLPFIIIGVVIVVITAFVLILKDSPSEAFHREYTGYGAINLEKDHSFKEIKYKTFKKKLEEGENMIVFFGMPISHMSVLEVPFYDAEFKADDLNLEKYFDHIYYVDVRRVNKKQRKELVEVYFYDQDEDDPLLLYFKDGELKADRHAINIHPTDRGNIYEFFKAVKMFEEKAQ